MSEQEKGYFNGYADALVARKKAQEKEVDDGTDIPETVHETE